MKYFITALGMNIQSGLEEVNNPVLFAGVSMGSVLFCYGIYKTLTNSLERSTSTKRVTDLKVLNPQYSIIVFIL